MEYGHNSPVSSIERGRGSKGQRFGEYVGKKRGGVRFTETEDGGGQDQWQG
jgi:hypothetical protein